MALPRRPAFQVEELEARLLYSADLAPLAMQLQGPALMAFALPEDDLTPAGEATSVAERINQPARHEIVFVDAGVVDAGALLGAIAQDGRTLEVIWLDAGSDGVDQISQALDGRHDLAAIHIVSHGGSAALQLGAGTLDAATLAQRAGQVAHWGDSLAAGADLLLYGCDVARGDAGERFVADLALLTGADVAASDDITGHAARGGDWALEVQAGAVETALAPSAAAQQRWIGALATYTVTNTNDSGAGSLRQAISDANGNAGTDTIAFSIGGGGAQTIAVTSSLPTITGTTVVDGRTQDGYTSAPLIELDGSAAGANVDGLTFSSTSDGSSVYGLAIVDFDYDGIWLTSGADGITVRGNYLGIGLDGVTAKPNYSGINIYSADNVIGGTAAADRNVISGNGYGLFMATPDTANNLIQGNYIGTDAAGTAAVANAWGIVLFGDAHDNTIGGTAAGARNVISGNTNDGVHLSDSGTSYNTVAGNYIGTSADGTAAIANNVGVFMASGTHHNTIGGTAAGAGNVISGNTIDGIQMLDAGTSDNTVAGNIIGLNAAGTAALANTNQGIAIFLGASNNTIGGTTAGAGNVISGNGGDGIRIEGLGTTGNVVSGNTIGLNGAGTAAVANGIGIRVLDNASANTIGGTTAGAGNVIAGNTQQGVFIEATASGISILGNTIRDNGALGIDLGTIGATANDAGDADSGANTLQNFPVLTNAFSGGGNTTVNGTINSTASSSLRIEFFSSPTADGSGHGEGATYLGFLNLTTDASGDATFSALLAGVSVLSGHRVTATATLLSGGTTPASTSEFAQTVAATVAPVHTVPGAQATSEDTTLVFSAANGNAISIGDDSGATLEVALSVSQGTLTLSQLSGLSIVAGANGSATMTVSGSVADLNAALDGLAYQPGADYSGAATLTITSSDAALVSLNVDAALIARYAFDDTASLGADTSGNGQAGTVVGAVAANDATRGDVLSLDGAGDHIGIAGMFGNPGQVTLTAWVYVDPADTQGEVISLGDNVQLRVDHNGTRVSASFYDGTGFRKTESGDVMTTGGWHHIAYVVDDAANTQTVYIDGAVAASTSFAGSISYTLGTDSFIGIHGNGNTTYDYKGLIDEARVFSRALSATEVMALALTDTDEVAITVNPVNDAPVIGSGGGGAIVAASVAENGTEVTTVTASDADTPAQTLTYAIAGGADAALFTIDASTGVLSFAAAPDFESPDDADLDNVYEVTVEVTDGNGGSDTQAIAVMVTDVDEFNVDAVGDGDAAANAVAENAADGSTVGITASASDADGSDNTITYSLSDSAGGRFAIDAGTGVVTVADGSLLDHESAASHGITVVATSADGSTSSQSFTIGVSDVDEFDVGAVTDSDAAANTVAENASNGAAVGIVAAAADADGSNSTIVYSLSDDAGGRFAIDASTGAVSVLDASLLDFETTTSHDIVVLATSADGSTSSQTFSIAVTDSSEFGVGAISDADAAANQASESAGIGSTVGITAQASDPDGTDTVSYSLADDAGGRFVIDANTGVVTTAAALDAEAAASHDIVVTATSSDLSVSTRSFTIVIADVDEFDVGAVSDGDAGADTVAENAADGSTVGITAGATDADASNDTVTYSLSDDAGGRFAIDATSGVVTVADGSLLDFEAAASHGITVLATSADGSTSSQSFTVSLSDVNEFDVGPVTDADAGVNTVAENAADGSSVGVTAAATDADGSNNGVTYSLTNGAGGRFAIDATTGVVTVADGSLLDFEAATSHGITVLATSADGSTSSQSFTINLTDADEFNVGAVSDGNAAANAVAENAANGSSVGITAAATDADASSNTVTYSLTGDAGGRFAIDAGTGVVTVANGSLLDRESAASHAITVLATSADGSTRSQSFTIALTGVNDNSPVITSNGGGASAVVHIAENGTAVTVVSATDGDLPAQTPAYSIVGGADAARFTIDASTGALAFANAADFESPADADGDNVYDVTVQASDGAGASDTQAISVHVTAIDDAPLAAPDAVAGDEDGVLSGNVLLNDSDAEGQTLGASLVSAPTHGQVTLAADGSFVYRPDADWFGTDSFAYRVSAGDAGADGQVTLQVTPVNDAPTITHAHLQMNAGVALTLDTSALDAIDIDTDAANIGFEVGSISGGRIERAGAPGVAVDRFTLDELAAGQLRVVPTEGALQIVLRTSDGETPGDWVALHIDTVPPAPEVPPVVPAAPPVSPLPAAPPPAPAPPVEPAPAPPSDAAAPRDVATTPAAASPPAADESAAAIDAAPPPRFAAERVALPGTADAASRSTAAAASTAESAGGAGAGADPVAIAEPTQLVIDLRLDVALQRLAATPLASAGARALAVGETQPVATDSGPSMEDAARRLSMDVETIEVAGLTLTVGVIWWALRLAGVAGSLLVSLPAWSMIDPLPILGAPPEDDDTADDAADASQDADEHAAAEVFTHRAAAPGAERR